MTFHNLEWFSDHASWCIDLRKDFNDITHYQVSNQLTDEWIKTFYIEYGIFISNEVIT